METSTPRAVPLSLFAFSIFYGGMVCIAGVLGNKQVALGPLAVEAGIFAFLLLVVTSSAVAELFGRDTANRLVLIGFVPLILSIVLAEIVLMLPPSPGMPAERLAAFNTMMGSTPRIWVAGIVAYGISQMLNVLIFSKLRAAEVGSTGPDLQAKIKDVDSGERKVLDVTFARRSGRLLWLRAGIASMTSQIVDTFLFITIAFYGLFPIGSLLLGQLIAKVVLSAVLVSPLIYVFVAVGRRLDGTRTG